MENSKIKEVLRFVVSIVIPLLVGYVGSATTIASIPTWYATIIKPSWAPPNWIFGSVWTILYVLMGIALYLVWSKGLHRKDVQFAVILFVVQLLLNLSWSIVFFGYHALFGSFVLVLVLWLAILANLIAFYVISKTAGLLLVPYILWVSIASYLNYSIYLLNR